MARGRLRTFNRATKRLTTWGNLADQGFTGVATGGSSLISSTAFEEPGTIIRARGIISIRATAEGASQTINGAFGVGLVSAEALAVGITALPTPHSDADWGGWMVWKPFGLRWLVDTAVGAEWAHVMIEIDSKAMRKVEASSAMVFVAESQSGAFDIIESVRLLLKLA